MNLSSIAPGLQYDTCGYWSVPGPEAVSYAATDNDFCFGVEDESFWFAHRNAAILATFRRWPPAPGPVFDVGAGNGYVAAALSAAGFETVPIEPNPAGAANAVRRGLPHVVRASLISAGFRDHTAGGIGLFDVLEHVHDEGAFLAEARRCLMPDGRLYLTVPAYQALWSAEDDVGGHCRRYTGRQLTAALDRAGFTVEYVTGLFWWLPLPIALFRVLPYRFSRRVDRPPAASATEHTLGGHVIRRLARASLAFEIACIGQARSVPFGGSWLTVGRVRR